MKKQSIPRWPLQDSPEGGELGKQMLKKPHSKTVGHFLKMLQHIKSWQRVRKVFSNVGLALFN